MISGLKRLQPAWVRRRLGLWRARRQAFPQEVSVELPAGKPCLFDVAGPVERERVLGYGAEKAFLRSFLAEVSPGDVVFDIGSCVGLFALPAAQKGGRVVAFEPDPGFRAALVRNVKINRLERLITIKA